MDKPDIAYKVIFYSSRIITLIVLVFLLACFINAQYMIAENLFPYFYSFFVPSNPDISWFINAIKLYIILWEFLFVFFVYNTYVSLYVCVSIFIAFASCIFFKNIFNRAIINILFFLLIYFTLVFRAVFDFQWTYFIFLITSYMLMIYINLYVKSENKLIKFFQLIPIVADVFLIKHVLHMITKKFILFKQIIFFTMANAVLFVILIGQINLYKILNLKNTLILPGDFYNLNHFKNENIIISNDKSKREVITYNLDNNQITKHPIICKGTFDGAVYNIDRNEYYFYDEVSGIFTVLDNKFQIKNKKQIASATNELYSGHRIIFDNNNIILILEKGRMFNLDITNLNIIGIFNIPDRSDYAEINKFRNSYIITFWLKKDYLLEYSVDSKRFNKIQAPVMQGYVQISNRNKEVYVAYHQKGQIYVYDAINYKLKRKIKTNYTVKNIRYDEDLDILIAPSYMKGNIDIFLMDGSDKLIWRGFAGYILRDAIFDVYKKNLIIASQYGLYKIHIDIKEIIKFHMKQ